MIACSWYRNPRSAFIVPGPVENTKHGPWLSGKPFSNATAGAPGEGQTGGVPRVLFGKLEVEVYSSQNCGNNSHKNNKVLTCWVHLGKLFKIPSDQPCWVPGPFEFYLKRGGVETLITPLPSAAQPPDRICNPEIKGDATYFSVLCKPVPPPSQPNPSYPQLIPS